ncbi:MAG: MBL fold metallo-hydrolase [Candidatus Bathyarchaeia archaeon]
MEIKTVRTRFFRISVNCYLVGTESGFVLVDTGPANRRKEIKRELESMGCRRGNLKLIVLTSRRF